MFYISREQAVFLYNKLIDEYGGEWGINDLKLEECLIAPENTFMGRDLYPEIFQKAACYLYNVIVLHAFDDGNKRAAYSFAQVFLNMNGYDISCTDDEAEELATRIAEGTETIESVTEWVEKFLKRIEDKKK